MSIETNLIIDSINYWYETGGGVESLPPPRVLYGGAGDDPLTGTIHNDHIYGLGGDDHIYGMGGDDTLIGGNGNDSLWGGSGADRFVFNSLSEGIDIIKDYNRLEGDRITIGFGATSTNQFSYNSNTGALFFQGTQFATLENKPTDFSTSLNIELVSTLLIYSPPYSSLMTLEI